MRSVNANKDGTTSCRSGAAASQVCSQCLADVRRQRETLDAIAFASDDELTGAPIEVIESQRADLTGAQAETYEEHQDGEVSPARPRSSIARRQETLDFAGLKRSR